MVNEGFFSIDHYVCSYPSVTRIFTEAKEGGRDREMRKAKMFVMAREDVMAGKKALVLSCSA